MANDSVAPELTVTVRPVVFSAPSTPVVAPASPDATSVPAFTVTLPVKELAVLLRVRVPAPFLMIPVSVEKPVTWATAEETFRVSPVRMLKVVPPVWVSTTVPPVMEEVDPLPRVETPPLSKFQLP